jgi:hypothetical protein
LKDWGTDSKERAIRCVPSSQKTKTEREGEKKATQETNQVFVRVLIKDY